MTLFVDASAMVAMISKEPEATKLEAELAAESTRLTSGIAMWEATLAVARRTKSGVEVAQAEVERFRSVANLTIVLFGATEAAEAVRAHIRYGKGSKHPARLNMGDCFAYACAKVNKARLLYKGDDFSHTDLA